MNKDTLIEYAQEHSRQQDQWDGLPDARYRKLDEEFSSEQELEFREAGITNDLLAQT